MQAFRKKGFWVGIILFFVVLLSPTPSGLSEVGWIVAAVTLLMATWWATEAVPVAVTALLPITLFPILGVADIKTAASHTQIQIYISFLVVSCLHLVLRHLVCIKD